MKKNNAPKKSIRLQTETIRALRDRDIAAVQGGAMQPSGTYCSTHCTTSYC
jgi:hypothetical protein